MSLIAAGEEVKYAKALVNPDKALRDDTLQNLNKYVSGLREIEDLEMMKLWKGLYYCMWLSDKQDIQMELAVALSSLIDKFHNKVLSLQFIRLFFRTIMREWFSLDQYRVNKFYTLIRLFLNRSFNLASKAKWASGITTDILQILKEEVLSKSPNGIRFHIADIYLHELLEVTEGNMSTEHFLAVLKPFVDVVLAPAEAIFVERVQNSVFQKFLEEYAGQNDAEEGKPLFNSAITLAVQQSLFDLASAEETLESARKRLYALHKSFAQKSGVAFVQDSDIKEAAKNVRSRAVSKPVEGLKPPAPVAAAPAQTSEAGGAKDKSKKKKRAEAVEEVKEPEPEAVKESVKPAKKAKTEPVPVPVEEAKPAKKAKTESKAPVEPAAPAPAPVSVLKTKAPKEAPAPTAAAADEKAAFIASSKFAGAKPGYVFHKGAKGLGYYIDTYVRPTKKVQFTGGDKKGNKRK